ncbi:tetratricopeptide repeat protein [Hyalangium rubrum]|uniref:Tetratricopeptide repeat protein n=1 Tax=Hyalangium rubrum TaxID=3103134 RepID=A0ABU5H9L6_9BACT|nr:tetratricopeptide repeat protein [Hyalangium sp. s54d21]MDY7230181.1 tetratricopeptide repeat protein [Hyalangium sp. s54d21]
MSENQERTRRVDVVILTAITLEYQAALQVEAGALPGSSWEKQSGPNGLPVAFRSFSGKGGRPLRVAVAQAGDMGAVAATNALLPLVAAYQPRCVAMCGVCAGRPGKTNLGDVVAAERLFFHDTGKRLPDQVQQDLRTYNLRDDWKVKLEEFGSTAPFRNEDWWKQRPIPYVWQENWVLLKLAEGVENPSALPESEVYCPQWEKVIDSLWRDEFVHHGTLKLTEAGLQRIGPLRIKYRNRIPDLSPTGQVLPFKIHVAPMGSGNQVIEDERAWGFISEYMRKTLGLEMEAAALGALVHAQRDQKLDALVMKGVMDFANHGRDDHFKEFAARASAEYLIAFLRENLEVDVIPGLDDLLVSESTEKLPEKPPPSALLQARYQVVPFHEGGREPVLAELDRWCHEGPPVAVRLLHGEGGIGKTRLALEWMHRLEPRGWKVGFLPKGIPGDWFEKLWASGAPVLVVLDYAESRFKELPAVLRRMWRYARQEGMGALRRVRLLLLARNAGDWWTSLLKADSELEVWLGTTPPYELRTLAQSETDRERLFHEAATALAEKRGKRYERRAPMSLSDPRFERVLYLHMAALAAVEGLEFNANTLMEIILDHEERFWAAGDRQSQARQIVAAATLRGGLKTFEEAQSLTQRILGRPLSDDGEALIRHLHRLYQRGALNPAMFLPALEPDLLGEGMVLRMAGAPPYQADALPTDWIDRVFPVSDEPAALRTGLEVLGRASAMQPSVAQGWLKKILAGPLHSRAKIALEAAMAVGQRTALSVLGDELAERLEAQGDVELARELEAVGIPEQTVSLLRVAEWTGRTLLQALPDAEDPKGRAERAGLLTYLGLTLSALGRREEALKATEQAVELHRVLAQRNPDAFQADLAMSLNNLGLMLAALGRPEEALKATEQATETYRALAQSNPIAYQPNLAGSLNNLGNRLSELGRREEALKATEQAAEAYRALAQRNPDAFQADLAGSLTNLGTKLRALGRRAEALKATEQAVELLRTLAQRNPDAFQPDFALSLSNLGLMLSAVGRKAKALKATEQAVELRRALAQRNPDAFQPDLGSSLGNLGLMLSELGRQEEALKATEQAVELFQALAQRNPDAFQPSLAMGLHNLGPVLSALGRQEEALKATEQAIALRRTLAQRNPDAFLPDLGSSLNNLGNRLSALGRSEEALKATEQAVELRRALAQRNPDAFLPDLAMSLSNLGKRLIALGRPEEAFSAAEEALSTLWPFFERNPYAFVQTLKVLLINVQEYSKTLQRPLSPAIQEYKAIFERLTKS